MGSMWGEFGGTLGCTTVGHCWGYVGVHLGVNLECVRGTLGIFAKVQHGCNIRRCVGGHVWDTWGDVIAMTMSNILGVSNLNILVGVTFEQYHMGVDLG